MELGLEVDQAIGRDAGHGERTVDSEGSPVRVRDRPTRIYAIVEPDDSHPPPELILGWQPGGSPDLGRSATPTGVGLDQGRRDARQVVSGTGSLKFRRRARQRLRRSAEGDL